MPRHSPDALLDLTISVFDFSVKVFLFTIVFLSVNSGFSQQIDFEIVTLSLSPSWRQASSRFVVYLSSLGFYIFSYATLFSFQGTTASLNKKHGGLEWTRTTDLTLIRRAL